jgi:hypothetical protein
MVYVNVRNRGVKFDFVVIRIGIRSRNVLDYVNHVFVEIYIVFLVFVRAGFACNNQLIRGIVGQAHITFHFQHDKVSSRIIDGDLTQTLKVVCGHGKIVIDHIGGCAANKTGCQNNDRCQNNKKLFHKLTP